ncbi:MAG: IPTL-CTERM sorting domain-containing protein [Thermodesulfobacteriota bacterium]
MTVNNYNRLETGSCSGFQIQRDVPTLSKWGLIAMAGVLGIVGFMVVRRKQTAS